MMLLMFSLGSLSFGATDEPLLAGTIRDRSGRPVRGADICLYRADYQTSESNSRHFPRGASRCRKTDADGSFKLYFPDRSTYVLIAGKKDLWTVRSISPGKTADTIVSSDTLRPSGTLTFSITAENTDDHRARCFLSGTPYSFTTDTSGRFQLKNIPAGSYGAVIQPFVKGYRTVVCTLRVRSAEVRNIDAPLIIPRESVAFIPSAPEVLGESSAPSPKPLPTPVSPETTEQIAPPPPSPVANQPIPHPVVSTRTPPVVKAPADTFIGIFESLILNGTATDNQGISQQAWDIGATGRFIPTPDGRIELPPFKTKMERLPCIFRATGTSGLSAEDTTYVWAGLLWMSITPPDQLLGRNGHSFLVFNDALFIIGGNRSDAWSSSDAVNWTMLTTTAPFGKLFGHATVVFSRRLWIIGGKTGPAKYSSPVWSSSTGVQWQQEGTLPFTKRHYHTATVFQGKIWVIGGIGDSETEPFLNDIWSSSDGRSWNRVTDNAPFGKRYGHSCIVYNNQLYLFGGFNDAVGSQTTYRDVWRSPDGVTWEKVTATAPFSGSNYHAACIFDNRLWAVGGYTRRDGTDSFSDILFTNDGTAWTNLTPDKKTDDRFFCAAVSFNGKIIISPSDSHKLWIMR